MKSVFFFHYARWTLNSFYYPTGCFAAATVYMWAIHCGHRVKYKGTGRPHFIYFCQKDRKILFIILFLFFSLTGSPTKIILLACPEQNVLLKGQEQAVIGRISQSDFFFLHYGDKMVLSGTKHSIFPKQRWGRYEWLLSTSLPDLMELLIEFQILSITLQWALNVRDASHWRKHSAQWKASRTE